ncbi:MAG: glutaredoxin family protein [Pseudomonadota bacterium]
MNENAQKQKKTIRLITLSTCFFCNRVKKMLDEAGFKYESTDIDMLPEDEREKKMTEIRKHNPQESFPIVIIGDRAFVGFQEENIKKELGIS